MVFSHLARNPIQGKELFTLVKDAIVHASSKDDGDGHVMAGLRSVPGKPLPFWTSDVNFSHYVRSVQFNRSGTTSDTGVYQVEKELRQVTTSEEAGQIISQVLIMKISKLSMTPVEDIVPEKLLAAYGLDSLVAIERRNWLIGEPDMDFHLLN